MSMSERADPGRADGGGRPAVRQGSVDGTARSIAATAAPSAEMGVQLLFLQRSAGNRATARLMELSRSPAHRYQVVGLTPVQGDDPVTMPADSITGSRGAATVAKLREMDSARPS